MIFPYANLNSFSLFFSADSTQHYLKKCYQDLALSDAEQKSYENCYPFIYYLEHGQVYYEQARNSPLIIQPILIFYGLVHLLKACILTVDPNYPETTSVLAHGVSTRKRKKQQYHFFQDEVKFQKTGLFPHIGERLFHMKQLEGEKTTMNDLLMQIPELTSLFEELVGKRTFLPVGNKGSDIHIPEVALDTFHMTSDRFAEFFQTKTNGDFVCSDRLNESLCFQLAGKKLSSFSILKYNLVDNYFSLSLTKGNLLQYNELLIHYLLLYNLSMIARYETEWWSELVKTMPNKDFPFIQSFLQVSLDKGPFLVYQYLMMKK
ncbi:YaaC family protein [Bacillus coreaensis]